MISRLQYRAMAPEKGFTLIELLVVISIIGLLAAIVLVSVRVAYDKGIAAKQISIVKQFEIAMGLYMAQYGDYPPVNTPALNGTSDVSILRNAVSVANQYIPDIAYNDNPIYQYTHVCSDTTPCDIAGQGTNLIMINLMCGAGSSAKALIVFRLKGGASALFRSNQESNIICYN